MNIVTACDREYYKFLPRFLEQAIRVMPFVNIVVYDLGMSTRQINAIEFTRVKYQPWAKFTSDGVYPEGYKPRALHKPSMLLHACRSWRGPIVYMDVDTIIVSEFEVPDCDVAVTMKRREEIKKYAGTDLEEYLGFLDAGVIMFGPDNKRELFCAAWVIDLQKDNQHSDQKSLNRIVARCHNKTKYNITKKLEIADDVLRIRILHEDDYNSSVASPDAKILHLRVHENTTDKPSP